VKRYWDEDVGLDAEPEKKISQFPANPDADRLEPIVFQRMRKGLKSSFFLKEEY